MEPRKLIVSTLASALLTASAAFAFPSVEVNSVVQRWPWNNKVDITYTVGEVETLANGGYYRVVFTATIPSVAEPIVIDGSHDVIAKAVAGTHTVTWTPPDGVYGTGCTMNVDLYETTGDYMIVDLDTGNYAFEDMRATLELSNARYNTDQNKGERLVLRRVSRTSDSAYPGGYPTGNTDAYPTANTETTWTTDKDYFIGIFELTRAQYDRIFGTISDSYLPKGSVQWQTLRGVTKGASPLVDLTPNVSGNGVFQRLSGKTGLYFDLPTELMWEIACRAGESKAWPWGADDATDLGTYAWYGSSSGTTHAAGGKSSNAWGLFDMLGNVMEICRDGASQANLADASSVFIPAAVNSDNTRRVRGGWVKSTNAQCNPSARATVNHYSFAAGGDQGCRVALYIR